MATKSITRIDEPIVGINRMVVTTPHLALTHEELAKAVSTGNAKRLVGDLISEFSKEGKLDSIQRNALAVVGQNIEKHTTYEQVIKEADTFVAAGFMTKERLEKLTDKQRGPYIAPSRVSEGLGTKSIILPAPSETNATFVAEGVYRFIKGVADSADDMKRLSREPIDTIYYATESNADRSRPELQVSLSLAGAKLLSENREKYKPILDMLKDAVMEPVTYACVGGVIALNSAVKNVAASAAFNTPSSALVITADTAFYDPKTAPNAELSQGAGATVMWITTNPKIVEFKLGNGAHNETFPDFTKFGKETPFVHGKFSEIIYVYMTGKALKKLEEVEEKVGTANEYDFVLSHVPFPKQSIYLSSFLFAHQLKRNNPELLEKMESRESVGKDPLEGKSLTTLIEKKLEVFNTEVSHGARKEQEVVKYIQEDSEIIKYWDWLKKVREQPEFKAYSEKIHIQESLELPSRTGNTYSSAVFVSLASALTNLEKIMKNAKTSEFVMIGYGSGAHSIAKRGKIVATQKAVDEGLDVTMALKIDPKETWADVLERSGLVKIKSEQYQIWHPTLIKGEAERTTIGVNLLDETKKLLRSEKLPNGFHTIKRNNDGTGEYVYIENGVPEQLLIRH